VWVALCLFSFSPGARTLAQEIDASRFAACSAIANDVERLTCYDALARELGLLRKPDVSTAPGNWTVRTEVSPLDDSESVYLVLPASAPIPSWPMDVTPTLYVRCKENVTEVYLVPGLVVAPDIDQLKRATVTVRFEKEPAFEIRCDVSTNSEALFFPNAVAFARLLMKHDSMLVQFEPYNDSPKLTRFTLTGLSEVAGSLRQACGW
jgi:type VI secretion system protein VasI